MSWGWNNGNNKWIKGKFADIETSPHSSQPGACIKILQQDTRGNASAVFENLILHSHTVCDGTRRLRHVEEFINHQPAVVELRVIDKDSVQMTSRSPGVCVCCHHPCPRSHLTLRLTVNVLTADGTVWLCSNMARLTSRGTRRRPPRGRWL